MKMNMTEVLNNWKTSEKKKPVPILSFPIAQKMGLNVTELLSTPENQAKGLKMLADEVDSWAILTYMDLSVETEAFGGKVTFADNEVPNVADPIVSTREEAEALKVPEVGAGRTGIYIEGCRQAVELIEKDYPELPVLAGCIGPFSMVGRLMDLTQIMMSVKKDPETIHILLRKATAFIIEYAKAYKEAGANGIAMAEPLAGLMPPKNLKEFSSEYVKQIVDAVQDENFAVIYHNCGSSTVKSAMEIYETGCMAYHFGNVIKMEKMLEVFPDDKIVMGNIDPAGQFCNGTPESMHEATCELLEKCGYHSNFVISSGCDIPAHSPWDNINAFFDTVKEYYQ